MLPQGKTTGSCFSGPDPGPSFQPCAAKARDIPRCSVGCLMLKSSAANLPQPAHQKNNEACSGYNDDSMCCTLVCLCSCTFVPLCGISFVLVFCVLTALFLFLYSYASDADETGGSEGNYFCVLLYVSHMFELGDVVRHIHFSSEQIQAVTHSDTPIC